MSSRRPVKAEITPEVLRWVRERAGLSFEQAAVALRVDVSQLQDWEVGRNRPTFSQIRRVADFYDVPTALFWLPEPPSAEPSGPTYYVLPRACTEVRHVIEVLRLSYHVGTALAYLCRAGRKPGARYVDDLRKAVAHLQFELERAERAQADAPSPAEGVAVRG